MRARRTFVAAATLTFICLLGAGFEASHAPAPAAPAAAQGQPPMAENVYLNIQVLKGILVDQFNDTMGMFASALLLDCVGCHDGRITADPKAFALSTPRIERARQMVVMMNNINRLYFGGQRRVTCFTCHAGDPQPERSPSLTLQYSELVNDPSSWKFFPDVAAPPAEKVLARYIEAVGGAQRLAALTSFSATGTYLGFETSDTEVPFDVVARAPEQRAEKAETGANDLLWYFNGNAAGRYHPDTPIPLIEFTGWSLSGSRVDTKSLFPATLVKAFQQWQMGYAAIDGREVIVARGVNPNESPVNLHFDSETGLLVRLVRWVDTAAGPVPVQIDYSDYRDVAGVKMPFTWVRTWTNGQSNIKLKEIRPNVTIDNARFARPNVPATSLR
jgi:hypothetical protein